MKRAGVLPLRVRVVGIVTGIAGCLTLFPGGLLTIQPVLLIAGGMTQHHFLRPGKWLLWLGAAGLSIILGQYDLLLFRHPVPIAEYVRLPFPFPSLLLATTILAVWCDVELVVQYSRSMHTRMVDSSRDPTPVSRGTWIFAAVINLWVGWSVGSAPWQLDRPGAIAMLLMFVVWVLAVVAFDIELVRRAAKTRYGRPG